MAASTVKSPRRALVSEGCDACLGRVRHRSPLAAGAALSIKRRRLACGIVVGFLGIGADVRAGRRLLPSCWPLGLSGQTTVTPRFSSGLCSRRRTQPIGSRPGAVANRPQIRNISLTCVGAAGIESATPRCVKASHHHSPTCPHARQRRSATAGPSTAEQQEATASRPGSHLRSHPWIRPCGTRVPWT